DFYKIALANDAVLTATLGGLTANADLQLLDAAGSVLVSSANTGNANDEITRSLTSGSYSLRVVFAAGDSNYFLGIGLVGGSIAGTVFEDSNGDGAKALGEPPLGGVTVFLDMLANNTLD